MKIFKLFLPALFIFSCIKVAGVDNASAQSLYIYNFIRYVKWPANNNKDFVIGVYGESAIYDELVALSKNRKVGAQNITVKLITRKEDISVCQLLYLPSSKKQMVKEISEEIGNKPILLISEVAGKCTSGCTIEFVYSEDKLLFRINEEKAKIQNLYMSQALINLASKI